VYWLAHALVGTAVDAEDVTQETFLVAWRKIGGLQLAGESLLPWLVTICRFQAANRVRRQKRDREHLATGVDETLPATVDVEKQVVDADLADRIAAELSTLGELDQEIFRLCAAEGYGYRAAADRSASVTVRPQSSLPHPHTLRGTIARRGHDHGRQRTARARRRPRRMRSRRRCSPDRRGTQRSAEGGETGARAVRRGRLWMGGTAAAALVAVAAIIAPSVLHALSVPGASSIRPRSRQRDPPPPRIPAPMDERGADSSGGGAASDGSVAMPTAERQIAVSASATVDVQDAASAAQAIATAAADAGGYVESQSTGTRPGTGRGAVRHGPMMPAPATAWITVRVPADALSQVVKGLSTLGEVTASQIDRRDVTTEPRPPGACPALKHPSRA
jgi:RNA polymerase sigma factor (sigma-70 family)